MNTPLGIRKIGTQLWASRPIQKGNFSIVEWGDRDDAMKFGSILDIGPFMAEYNLKNCEAVRLDDASTSTEAYFADLDKFLKYVHERMNPARIREGLLTINDGQATHIYDAIKEGRYLR